MVENNSSAGRIRDPGIRTLFSSESRWQAWLDVEAALAACQAELGLIPEDAAIRIASVAHLENLDLERIAADTLRTSHRLVPLVWELARVAGEDAGGWIHWGATTQNIVQTGDILILRRAHEEFLHLLGTVLHALSDLATRTGSYPIAGRTHGQHAVPATFGFKVAVWIDALCRNVQRLRECESRVFVAMLGGAVGNYASTGELGPSVQERTAIRLGLTSMAVPARNNVDHLAEYVALLGLLAGTTGNIAKEIFLLTKTDVGEVEEPLPGGTIGSSTMPQKRNPQLCEDIMAESARIRTMVPLALEGIQVEHEGDRAHSLMIQDAVQQSCVATGEILARLVVLLEGLKLVPERMQENLNRSGGLIMAEAVMLRLGETMGRQLAHEVVYEIAQRAATESLSFAELLMNDKRILEHMAHDDVDALLDPLQYTGLSEAMACQAADIALSVSAELTRRGTTAPGSSR